MVGHLDQNRPSVRILCEYEENIVPGKVPGWHNVINEIGSSFYLEYKNKKTFCSETCAQLMCPPEVCHNDAYEVLCEENISNF